jgi:hypothetical protein
MSHETLLYSHSFACKLLSSKCICHLKCVMYVFTLFIFHCKNMNSDKLLSMYVTLCGILYCQSGLCISSWHSTVLPCHYDNSLIVGNASLKKFLKKIVMFLLCRSSHL